MTSSIRLTLLALLIFLPVTQGCAQSEAETTEVLPEPAWAAFGQALEAAKAGGKKTMVFIYTDWCPYCQKTTNEVHTDEAILTYLEAHYTVTRLNAESMEPIAFDEQQATEAELAQALGAAGFPTTVFLDEKGEYITRLPGFMPADGFLTVLKFIAEDAYRTQSYQEYIEGS